METLVNKFGYNLEFYKRNANSYNEFSCRMEYIDQFLKLLGWDVTNEKGLPPHYREVIAENHSSASDRPDYSLTLRGVTKLFVEAKKPAVDIENLPESARQARKYGWNAKHKLAVLTNFEYFMIYDTTYKPEEYDSVTVALFKKYRYTEYVKKFDEIYSILSRDSIYNGNFDKYTKDNFVLSDRQEFQVDNLFLKQINSWRLQLSNYLYCNNENYNSTEILNDVVQEFINQIVFVRICEDRNLPLYHKLNETITNTNEIKEKLNELFRSADKRYNSGMYEGKYLTFDLDNQIIMNIIESLYYPQSSYLFNIIEPSLLGKIYEMFLAEQLQITDNNQVILNKKKDCINRSVVTTPNEIVKYMVSKCLEKLCSGKTPDQLLELRIADIACGSGVFLVEVYDYLINYCVNWYFENNDKYLIELYNGKKKLPLEDKKRILTSCIFGIDIDIHAVEVAKFSLLVKLIEDETEPSVAMSIPILPNLDCNIVYGNSLIDSTHLHDLILETDVKVEIAAFDWEGINDGQKFDLIIGNPPYVNTENIHNLLPREEFDIYKKYYKTAYKQFDKYFIFIERALGNIKDGGRVCFIVPNKFYKIGSGKELRRLISKGKYLLGLDDFGDAQLFDDKTIYSAILFLEKCEHMEFLYTKVTSANALWTGVEEKSILLKNDSLTEQPWRLSVDIEFMRMIKKLEKFSVPLVNHVEIYNGIQTSAEKPDPVYWFSMSEVVTENATHITIARKGNLYSIEKAILKPFYKPTKISEKKQNTYSLLATDKWIIFPYDHEGKLIPINKMQFEYKGAYEYLLSYYDRLLPKSISKNGIRDVQYATEDTWYQYGRTQALTAFVNNSKLIVGILSKEPMYAYDSDDMLIASGGTAGYCAISKRNESQYALEYIQAWLTHPYTEKLLGIISSEFENGFIARGTFVLQTLPFIELDLKDFYQKELYDKVIDSSKEIYRINKTLSNKTDKSTTNILSKEKNKLINDIEEVITKIYRLEFKG